MKNRHSWSMRTKPMKMMIDVQQYNNMMQQLKLAKISIRNLQQRILYLEQVLTASCKCCGAHVKIEWIDSLDDFDPDSVVCPDCNGECGHD